MIVLCGLAGSAWFVSIVWRHNERTISANRENLEVGLFAAASAVLFWALLR